VPHLLGRTATAQSIVRNKGFFMLLRTDLDERELWRRGGFA
jgi:hypothetical protein